MVLNVQIKVGFMNIVKVTTIQSYSLPHVMMEFKLSGLGGPTLSLTLPGVLSYVRTINCRGPTSS